MALHGIRRSLSKDMSMDTVAYQPTKMWEQMMIGPVCMLDLCEVGRAEFIIDPSDLHDKAKSLLYKLDDESAEYVIREVIDRIFASIGVRDSKLTQRYCVL